MHIHDGTGSLLQLYILKLRFASNKYSNESTKVGDVFTHLTNYSINKNSTTYMSNEDSTQAQVNLGFADILYVFSSGPQMDIEVVVATF